ncbi:DUF4145 domain-containing protein [Mycolicibacterium cosmeticum]|nr:DUF4145 domain-containing protein [Mycolicibacterium cosmeticum]
MEPTAGLNFYTCPYCETLCTQDSRGVLIDYDDDEGGPSRHEAVNWNRCMACLQESWWVDGHLVYPFTSKSARQPVDGMPDDVLELYREASSVADVSPRSAAALLRTALEVLTRNHLGQSGVSLNDAIGNLVKDRQLSVKLQQAMDVLRITGNDYVHPREVQLDDSAKEASAMFDLLNIIVDRLIVEPQRIAQLYADLPESKRQQVERRDG